MSGLIKHFLLPMIAIALSARTVMGNPSLREIFKESQQGYFQEQKLETIRRAEELFLRTYQQRQPDSELKRDWKKLGFEQLAISIKDQNFIILREVAGQKQGRGLFVFRLNGTLPWCFQAPHVPTDELTGDIVLKLMVESKAAAAAWNTVPRGQFGAGSELRSDMARLTNTFPVAFSRAFARHYPTGYLLQFHGFEQSKRKSATAAAADWILSNGTETPFPSLLNFARCLESESRTKVLVYPLTIRDLGSTRNSIAAALRLQGFTNFIHLESSRAVRQALLDDRNRRTELINCLPGSSQ